MIPHLIHFIWLGGPMPDQNKAWVKSVRDRHPDWSVMLWDEVLVQSLMGMDVKTMKELYGTWASVSNVIRLHVLFKFGGVYLDCDFEGIGDMGKLIDTSPVAVAAMQDNERICNAFMAAPPTNPWILYQLAIAVEYIGHGAEWGVYAATRAPGNLVNLVPYYWVYPFRWDAPAEERKPHPESILVHHWQKSW